MILTGWTPTFSMGFLLIGCICLRGGLTPLTSITSPVLPLGLAGAGCLRGSVGRSEADECCFTGGAPLRAGGGVIGGMRRG